MFMQFNAWEYLYYQNRDESIPKELWVGADESFKQFIETKPIRPLLVGMAKRVRRTVSLLRHE
jgi:hypothetical protein